MAYFTPYIDATGMHIPKYEDIRDNLIDQMKQIFGTDIYIDEDSQDYQQISIFARKIYDVNALALLVYNNRTPTTAIGIGLDSICAIAGIQRKPATYSTVQLTITGDAGTVITNGQATDGTYIWNLPETVTIPDNGVITVEATCNIAGNISASSNSITMISTPTFGWLSVTNNYNAQPGVDVETDASLRGRFAKSTLSPSSTVFDGIISAIETVEGVGRVKGYENDTGSVDSNGLPAHSVTLVVENGDTEQIANQIFFKKTPGCYTNGTTSVDITSASGTVTTIRFYRPQYKNIWVKVNIKKLNGYNDQSSTDIQNAVVDYINNLQIADTVYRSIIWSVATSQLDSLTSPTFAVTDVTLSEDGTTYNSDDFDLLFFQASLTDTSKVSVVVS